MRMLTAESQQYYSEVLGRPTYNLFATSFGLLLRSDLHSMFDRGEWALFPNVSSFVSERESVFMTQSSCAHSQGDKYIVHYMAPANETTRALHGKVIGRDRFRAADILLPDSRLLMFHYKQCAHKFLRGFSAGF